MRPDVFADYLDNRHKNQVEWYDRKADQNQFRYTCVQWAVIIFAAATPVLIELDLDNAWGEGYGLLATGVAVVVAVLTAALKTFKYQENWVNYRTTCEMLRRERYIFEANADVYAEAPDKEAVFVGHVEDLISRENATWVSRYKPKLMSRTDEAETAVG